ncbi:hemerythrin HHE cation binding domain-containing protein [Xylariales sp. PMI_506]|nr:hemerythrin HHE cation binding domain-containing protein [Xylariales sp. PMI_506]
MAEKKSWEKGPWPLISFVENGIEDKTNPLRALVSEMIVIHNAFIRGINSIYLQCINIEKSPGDVPDFIEYCAIWGKFIHNHHDEEESDVFPGIEELSGVPGLMAGNIEQHHAFHGGLNKYEAYLAAVKSGSEKYDGQKFKAIMDSFVSTLHEHLVQEIPTLLGLKQYSDKVDWKGYWEKKSAEIVKRESSSPEAPSIILPFILSCHDPTFENGIVAWPPFPWIAKMIFRYWFIPQHKKWWRFGPVDASGRPREIPFAAS